MAANSIEIGVISDTHGLMRSGALAALAGVAHIVHAGDIGAQAVLDALARVAPVTAVRGNNDHGAWAELIPPRAMLEVGGIRLLVVHDRSELVGPPGVLGVDAIVSGHSHRPSIQRHGDMVYVNPGSAGPRRFTLPIALARLTVAGGRLTGRIVELAADP